VKTLPLHSTDLPVLDVAQQLREALGQRDEAVLEAPPGAGKTTLVPLLLLDCGWLEGRKILMLEPRRMAARAAAHRMATLLGEKVGQRVGYRIRQDTRVGANTRIEVITEGILTRMLQTDPALEEVGLLIFDEFHERSVHSDLGLALALQGRELFREQSLKILVMSATLDGEAVASLLGCAPVIRSQGRQYPVEIHYGKARRFGDSAIPELVALLNKLMLDDSRGSILVFLPGRAEINRVQRGLAAPAGVQVLPLHGGLGLAEQELAISPLPEGQRKLVLSTNIAETSLTIEGINTVVDSGQFRQPAYDPATGMTRLYTRQVSRASSEQRAGRAGRLGPGRCFRLWSQEQQQQLAAHTPAEILQADLTPLALQLLAWGVDDPAELKWLDLPPAGALGQAMAFLQDCGVLESTRAGPRVLNKRGEQLARLPVHPRLGQMLLQALELGLSRAACRIAALLSEGVPTSSAGADLTAAYFILLGETPCPGRDRAWLQRTRQQERQLLQLVARNSSDACDLTVDVSLGLLLALAYPDRIARRKREGLYQLANGRSASLPLEDSLCRETWLAVAEIGGRGGQSEDRIYAAVALEETLLEDELSQLVHCSDTVAWDDSRDRFVAERVFSLGALRLSAKPLQKVDPRERRAAIVKMLREQGLARLGWSSDSRQWQARVCLLNRTLGAPWPDVCDAALLQTLEQWLDPWLDEVKRPADLRRLDLLSILGSLLPWPLPGELDRLAPRKLTVPSGSHISIDYTASPPVLAVKLQEMFGSELTPSVVQGRVTLQLHLLSPAQRPLQVTQDLPGFWRNAYSEVRKEMKGRYPRHPWPEDPVSAAPTRHTKRRM
jgi:ATP-dependent helicase HrpB